MPHNSGISCLNRGKLFQNGLRVLSVIDALNDFYESKKVADFTVSFAPIDSDWNKHTWAVNYGRNKGFNVIFLIATKIYIDKYRNGYHNKFDEHRNKKEEAALDILEQYYLSLANEAEEQKKLAESEAEKGDQRAQSICLMKASMLGDMLRVLGRVEHEGKRPNALETLIKSFSQEAEKFYKLGDYDAADRAEQKTATIQFALDALHEAENHGA